MRVKNANLFIVPISHESDVAIRWFEGFSVRFDSLQRMFEFLGKIDEQGAVETDCVLQMALGEGLSTAAVDHEIRNRLRLLKKSN